MDVSWAEVAFVAVILSFVTVWAWLMWRMAEPVEREEREEPEVRQWTEEVRGYAPVSKEQHERAMRDVAEWLEKKRNEKR